MAKQRVSKPGISGAVDDAVSAIKDYVGAGKRDVVTGDEASQMSDLDANTPSNAGAQAQSSDSSNKYD